MIKARRNILQLLGATALTAIGFGSTVTEASAADVTLRLHQFLPAQANVPKNIFEPWMAKIQEESGGRIEFQHFPAMQLGGKPPELIDQAIDGVADIVWTLPGYTPGRFPRTEVFELPFTMTNAEATSRSFWQLAEETMLDQDFKDVKVLGLWVHGPGLIHSKNPIASIDDLNGVKLRAPTRVTNQMFSELGATAIGMPIPAVPEALSKGVIDATVIPWEVTGALKINELVENHTTFGEDSLYTSTFVLAMNKDRWDALPDDLKAIIDANSGEEFSAFAGKQMQMDDAGPRDAAIGMGATIIELSPDQVATWKEAAAPVAETWIAEMDKNGLDGTGLRARALELIEANTK
ncbi:TRAP transporter substrate-binding protein [Aliiruegeria sabulilitoris]|uniref:TRAP transporter substrate-binding protein n=1 Tax=Aliiruegeria sabulilitoris TaxID=1510458 RepID=UPI000833523A|nr:TRAP transporter substrate-binding protein [Aliiruegeria sabulilitoris]NDR56219.1 TRAP transporter substrate-binding protein [Pseudoruegeria sp. M32A2M]